MLLRRQKMSRIYKNSTQVADLHGIPFYMHDVVDACLAGRLNLFLQGDTGAGKTQLAKDAMGYFGAGMGNASMTQKLRDKYKKQLDPKADLAMDATRHFQEDRTLFVLGRNDMDTRELFQQINLGKLHQKPAYNLEPLINPDSGEVEWYYPKFDEKGVINYQRLTDVQAKTVRKGLEAIAGSTDNIRELTSKINTELIVVDELPNLVPAVRAQLFNLFDGFIEIAGKAYPIGNGYSVGIATGNIGQQFTESANDLGRAIKDRMHVTVDVDHYFPTPSDTMNILAGNTNPRVEFGELSSETGHSFRDRNTRITAQPVPFSKLVIANYLLHGLDYCNNGASKRKMKEAWPNNIQNNQRGSDEALVLPISPRAAKSIIRLSQSLDDIALERGATPDVIAQGALNSMMQAYKLVSTHSGVLNEAMVKNVYDGDRYAAMDALIATTLLQFAQKEGDIMSGIDMVRKGKREAKIMNLFTGRWEFMRDTLD